MVNSSVTLIDLLQQRARQHPNKIAYTFLEDGKTEGAKLTYQQLDQRAKAIAAHLQSLNAYGERALLLYPAGLEILCALFGCLYAGVIGIPAPPPEASRLKRTLPRLQAIAKDAQTSLALTNENIISTVERYRQQVPEFQTIKWLDTEVIKPELGENWQPPEINGDTLAYLQYTSGSTATPKGVMITHQNVIYLCHNLQRACGYTPDSVTVTWIPYFHDYGLVEGLLEPLYNGTPCYVMSPAAFIKRPLRWLEAISRYQGTHSQAPNFAYDQCVRRISEKQRMSLNLSHWKAAGNGGEPINPEVLAKFAHAFSGAGFRPQALCPAYGLAEATLTVSFNSHNESFKTTNFVASELEKSKIVEATKDYNGLVRTVTSCGRLMPDINVKIVNPDTLTLCLPDELGEVWVEDPSVAKGYWQREKDTKETFKAYIQDTEEGPFLRTGDLGFIYQDQLYITGRIKDVIIIRGTNHYPQDIEWTVQGCHPALRPENGAVFSVNIEGEERLIITQEIERGYRDSLNEEEVITKIRQAIVEEHELDTYAVLLLKRGSLPKTASGKIQRRACQSNFLKGTLEVLGSWTANRSINDNIGVNNGKYVRKTQSKTEFKHNLQNVKSSLNFKPQSTMDNYHLENAQLSSNVEPKLNKSNGAVKNHNGHSPSNNISFSKELSESSNHAEVSKKRADKVIDWLRDYAEKRINSRLIDERRSVPPYIILDFGNQGILGMQIGEEYGGLALNYRDFTRVLEQLAAIDTTLATLVFLNNTNGIRPIQHYGTPTLKEELLPLLATGRELASFGLSEPGAGSSLGGIATVATPTGQSSWKLNGVKRWNASAWAGVISTFVRLVDENNKFLGITGFAVRQGTSGLRVGPEALTMGFRGIVQNSIYFEDVNVSSVNLLGEIGKGMKVANDALFMGRLCTAAVSLGAMKRCAQLMLRYASRRSVATGLLLDNPVTLAKFSQLTQVITVVDLFLKSLTQQLDEGKVLPPEIAMIAKIIGSEGAIKAADDCMQLLGGRGYMENNIVPQIYRDVRVLTIGEGPNENLRAYLGKSVMQSEIIHRYLENTLNGLDLSEKFRYTTQKVSERCLSNLDTWETRSQAINWAHYLMGDVVIYGVLLATIRPNRYLAADGTVEWLAQQFDYHLNQALEGTPVEPVILKSSAIIDKVNNYDLSIGNTEQGASGEENELESLLKRNFSEKKTSNSQKTSRPHPDVKNLSPDAKRKLLSKLLQQKSNSSNRS